MSEYLLTKFQVSSITVTIFRLGGNSPPPKRQTPENTIKITVKKLTTGQGENYTNGYLLDYEYIKNIL